MNEIIKSFSGDAEIHLRDYFYILRKRKKAMVLFFVLVVAGAVIFTYYEKVLYRGTAVVLIERENPNVIEFKEVLSLDASTTDYYQTQYRMLESVSLLSRLIEKENLEEDSYLMAIKKGGVRKLLRNFKYWPAWLNQFVAEPELSGLIARRMLRVQPVRNSRLVKVSMIHPDPLRAAELANAIVDLFIERNLQDRFLISKRATDLITNQLVQLKQNLAQAERKLQNYKEKNSLINIPSIRQKDKLVQEARLELVKMQAMDSKLSQRYLPEHPKLIHLRSQIKGLQERINEEEKKSLSTSRYAIEYAELEREMDSAKQIYEALLERLQETQSQANTQASNILIIDKAFPSVNPDAPRPFLNFAVAFLVGILGALGLAFFLEYLDSTIKIPEDIEKGLGLSLLGIIPEGEKSKNTVASLFFDTHYHSPAAESFRALRTALLFRLRHLPGGRTLLITSPNPEEGKSTTTLNLAAAFHQNHMKVLVIDADLRKPKLYQMLGARREKGFTDLLEDKLPFEEIVQKNVSNLGFDFLSCGSRSEHPAEVLGFPKVKELIEKLRKDYDVILLDSPPFLAVADVAVLSEYADAIIAIARYQRTDRRHLKNLKRRFNEENIAALGVVINRVSVREKDYYYHQYYYYGYGELDQKK